MSAEHGPLLRLWGISTSQLPPDGASSDDLLPFIVAILQEAEPFIDSAGPKSGDASHPTAKAWKHKTTKTSADSAAKVEVLERVIAASELEALAAAKHGGKGKAQQETWAVRRSVHADKAEKGTASWHEFVDCFKDRHSETEEAFTPAIVGAHVAMQWDCGDLEVTEGGETWTKFMLKVQEMRHQIGKPLSDRVFPVLQMSCAAVGKDEFLVVSLPLTDLQKSPHGRLVKDKGVVVGSYASVERIRKLPGGNIEWLMAVASDAKGVLPMRVQVLAIPGQIAKDPSLFFSWIAKERAKKGNDASAAPQTGITAP